MTLAELVADLHPLQVEGSLDRPVGRVSQDSREVDEATVFVAIRGARTDGRLLAASLHAAAVVADGPVQTLPGVAFVLVPDAREALAVLAARLAGDPSRQLPIVGVTGTNGKTTVSWMIEAIARAAGRKAGLIGTTGARIDGRDLPNDYTTPPPPALQGLLQQMVQAGCELAAMEVSSIGLSQRRVHAMRFAVAVFTSFSQDHLDVHGSMEAYLAAKLRLFEELLDPAGRALVHGADPVAPAVIAACGGRAVWTYGRGEGFDLCAVEVELKLEGSAARLITPAGEARLSLAIPGAHNIDNALAAVGAALALGIGLDTAVQGLAALSGVPGRMQRVVDPRGERTVIVDYAHSPDALERALATLRALGPRALRVVFGCGGDRDAGKRPLMGEVAARGADLVLLTNDNPRGEDPLAILAAIRAGVPAELADRVQSEPDRAAAIARAVALTGPGEALLIAGKGHERTQTIGANVLPFDDREVAAAALAGAPE